MASGVTPHQLVSMAKQLASESGDAPSVRAAATELGLAADEAPDVIAEAIRMLERDVGRDYFSGRRPQ